MHFNTRKHKHTHSNFTGFVLGPAHDDDDDDDERQRKKFPFSISTGPHILLESSLEFTFVYFFLVWHLSAVTNSKVHF